MHLGITCYSCRSTLDADGISNPISGDERCWNLQNDTDLLVICSEAQACYTELLTDRITQENLMISEKTLSVTCHTCHTCHLQHSLNSTGISNLPNRKRLRP